MPIGNASITTWSSWASTGGHLPPDLLRKYRRRLAQGFGCYPIIGDPDYVAEQYRRIFEAGVAGCTVAFVNYLDEVGLFADEVIPRLERLGVRRRRRFAVA
jgi:alkanesulfonate monooxygenase SsuD/methylene tetrahydromethanopterin reductase-like flavin-dependent oxidoreductase (luciferase family)